MKWIDNKKKIWLLSICAVFAMAAIICLVLFCPDENEPINEPDKPVRIMLAAEEERTQRLHYNGMASALELRKLSFKSGGVLREIYVQKGDRVIMGDRLLGLETKDHELALQAAAGGKSAAFAAYELMLDNHKRIEELYTAGAVSLLELEKSELEMIQAKTAYENSQTQYQSAYNAFEDAALKADIDGFVEEILYELGELIPGGAPAVIIRGIELEIKFGLAEKDLIKVQRGTKARMLYGDKEFDGKIESIKGYPDKQTWTYSASISIIPGSSVTFSEIPIGANIEILLETGQERGFYLPLSTIKNDGKSFVYIVDEDLIVQRRYIELITAYDSEVLVRGLEAGEKVIIEGSKGLEENDKVRLMP